MLVLDTVLGIHLSSLSTLSSSPEPSLIILSKIYGVLEPG
jgi:hypothetical protein